MNRIDRGKSKQRRWIVTRPPGLGRISNSKYRSSNITNRDSTVWRNMAIPDPPEVETNDISTSQSRRSQYHMYLAIPKSQPCS
jgi:hypothetical protein